VCFLTSSPRRLSAVDKGPWHPDEHRVREWARWFGHQGYRVAVQHSSGDLYEGNRRIGNVTGGRFKG
jgi:hypothetical protein